MTIRCLPVLVPALLALSACSSRSSSSSAGVNPLPAGFRFTDVHKAAGIDFQREATSLLGLSQLFVGGVAAGDYDLDGDVDLYVVGDKAKGNFLYQNNGDGTFSEVAGQAGVRLSGGYWSGAAFADFNGDGRPDLTLCGVEGTLPCLLANQGNGTFADVTPGSGLDMVRTNTLGASFGDYDRDGDLDLFLTQWGASHAANTPSMHLWRNKGQGVFEDVSLASGVTAAIGGAQAFTDRSMTANFSDIDADGWPDLLITGDEGHSVALRNDTQGGFTPFIVDGLDLPFASGAALGDVDSDGDLDWFVSGTYQAGDPMQVGNRLFLNDGQGGFTDGTVGAGLLDGSIGFAASFADFDNNGTLDLIQVNGFALKDSEPGATDRSRLFLNDGNGVFTDRAADAFLEDFDMGRGLVCFDYDLDGDVDVFVVNLFGEPRLWRNDGGNANNNVCVRLTYVPGNLRGAGARVTLIAGGRSQVRELRLGSNFTSQDPIEGHFGLGSATQVDSIQVRWPDGAVSNYGPYAAGGIINIRR